MPVPLDPVAQHLRNPGVIVPFAPGSNCVDGRYSLDGKEQGRQSYPAADLGDVLVLQAIQERRGHHGHPEHTFEVIFEIANAHKTGFHMHTDDQVPYAEPPTSAPRIGCGAASGPMNDERYGIPIPVSRQIVRYALDRAQNDPRVDNTVLHGAHNERFVGVVIGTVNTIKPDDRAHDSSGFIYTPAAYRAYVLQTLLPEIRKRAGIRIDPEEWFATHVAHLNVTLDLLARGLGIYAIDVDNPARVKVQHLLNAGDRQITAQDLGLVTTGHQDLAS